MIIRKLKKIIVLWLAMLVFLSHSASAELIIQITGGTKSAIPVAVVPFAWRGVSGHAPINVASIVSADLTRSGHFKTLPVRDMIDKPSRTEAIKLGNWRALAQDYLVIGEIRQNQDRFIIEFKLFDVYRGKQLLGYRLPATARGLRRTVHRISDLVYEELTGLQGVFNSRIAYVTQKRKSKRMRIYQLKVADSDGFNPKVIASSIEPIMSPAWSPDGKKIAYVSFEKKKHRIFIQTLATGKRSKIPAGRGINGAPAWSPDGSQLAITLSKDGSPDIYVVDLKNRSWQKLTKSYAIDTEPAWSPDGRQIVFTSDRGGKPQLYIIPSSGGSAKRLTYQGDYNARGSFSKDGRKLLMVHGNRGDYRIAIMDRATKAYSILTKGPLDESPTFSANSGMVLYAKIMNDRGVLSAISVDGRMNQVLTFDNGDVREPAWSP
jgi:TolB protein